SVARFRLQLFEEPDGHIPPPLGNVTDRQAERLPRLAENCHQGLPDQVFLTPGQTTRLPVVDDGHGEDALRGTHSRPPSGPPTPCDRSTPHRPSSSLTPARRPSCTQRHRSPR